MSDFSNYVFKSKDLMTQALTHKSYIYDGAGRVGKHNETLEFLGDAVVDLAVSEILMRVFPEANEGILSKKRASFVNEGVLAKIATELKLGERILLGKGEIISEGEKKPRLLASVYEALLGAVFLESGYGPAAELVEAHFSPLILSQRAEDQFESDFKTKLQEVVQADLRCSVQYRVVSEAGPSHEPTFETALVVLEKEIAKGFGRSKKSSEQSAAKWALENWESILLQMGVRKNKDV
jgi:ribonuclease-3